jgi:SOS-response transcriptional repressor LexA
VALTEGQAGLEGGAQERVLGALRRLAVSTGTTPSVREITEAVGWKSKGTTFRYLRELDAAGRVVQVDGSYWPADLPAPAARPMVPLLAISDVQKQPGAATPTAYLPHPPTSVPHLTSRHELFAVVAPADVDPQLGIVAGDVVYIRRSKRQPAAGRVMLKLVDERPLFLLSGSGKATKTIERGSRGGVVPRTTPTLVGVVVASCHLFEPGGF